MSKKCLGINKDRLKSVNSKKWSAGLIVTMKDPESIILEDDQTVTIKDKYPKAKHHLLVLCKESIPSIFALNKSHLPLLKHMKSVADKLCKMYNDTFKIGYHSVPSMQRLHMHIISDDFISPCLKTKIHWNSFTTEFFLSSEGYIILLFSYTYFIIIFEVLRT